MGQSGSILLRQATIVPGPDLGVIHGDILIKGNEIAAVQPTQHSASAEQVIDASGLIALPGLVNAHTHSPLSVVQGCYDTSNHRSSLWMFQAYTKERTPREVYLAALKNAAEMLLSGTTSVLDHFPEQNFTVGDVEAVVQAYRDAGMRAVIALRIYDCEYKDIFPIEGEFDDALLKDLQRENPLRPRELSQTREICEEAIQRFDGLDGGMIRIFPAPSNPMRCTDELLTMCADMRDRYGVGIHCHMLETFIQTEIAKSQYGCSMVQHLDRLGLLSDRFSSAHTIWIGTEDIALLGERGAVPVHNPESNSRGGSGIMPTPDMLEAGLDVAIGSDGSCSGGAQYLQRAMHLATMLHRTRAVEGARWTTSADTFRMGTEGGAKAMLSGGKLGRIATGYKADLALYRMAGHHWEWAADPVASFVARETGQSLEMLLVNGRVLVGGGQIKSFDWEAVREELLMVLPSMRSRNEGLFDLTQRLSQAVLRGGQGPVTRASEGKE